MGIIGLETFIDSLDRQSKHNGPFKERPLGDIQLVIDGNQLPHAICNDLHPNNEYGGNYDELYQAIKNILNALKPFINIIIFDGSKEDNSKAFKRFQKKIERLGNLKCEQNKYPSQKNHFQTLKECLPIFIRAILYKVINELKIDYVMADGMADHAVACYANGINSHGNKYTVLSRDSYFYAYNLDKGYLSMKYFTEFLRRPNEINQNTIVPIFELNNFLDYLGFKTYKSWLYFCVILGDRDLNLQKNVRYLKKKKLGNNLKSLVNHFKENENNPNLINNLRTFYNKHQLKQIDNLISQFDLTNKNYKFSNITSPNDFDRFVLSVKDLKTSYVISYVEDFTESTIFTLGFDILENIYNCLNEEINEYSREIIESDNQKNIFITYTFYSKNFPADNQTLNYLNQKNKLYESDDLTLFYSSILLWYEKLSYNIYNNKIEFNIPKEFIDSILFNWIILNLKSKPTSTKRSSILMESLFKEQEDYSPIIDLYNQITIQNDENKNNITSYFDLDLKLVHRFNEFQAVYFVLCIYSRLKRFDFEFLTPDEFLNGLFLCRFLKENKIQNTKSYRIRILIEESKAIQSVMKNIKKDLDTCFSGIFSRLEDRMQSLKI